MKRTALLAALLTITATPTLAHTGTGIASGFAHPFLGADHLMAMFAAGAWAVTLGGRAVWALPLAFLAAMAAGAAAGMSGLALPLVEMTIAASIVVLGGLLFARVRMPVWCGSSLVALFAFAHGHAHGAEIPAMASPIVYAMGFLVATALILALGAITARAAIAATTAKA